MMILGVWQFHREDLLMECLSKSLINSLSKAFGKLKLMLPWVPPDTKLSKLDTLRLATSYISHLQRVLDDNGDDYSSGNETKFQTRSLVRKFLN